VVPEILCVRDAHGHLHKVSRHELVLHCKAVLAPTEQGFKVRAADGEREGPDIVRLLVSGADGGVQLEAGVDAIIDGHGEPELAALSLERRRHMRGSPVILVKPGVQEDLLGRRRAPKHRVDLIHG
jgi:hypothetical protein